MLQAKRKPFSFTKPLFNNQLLRTPGPVLGENGNTISNQGEETEGNHAKLLEACQPIRNFLEFTISGNDEDSEAGPFRSSISVIAGESDQNVSLDISSDQFFVPSTLIERWGSAMGIRSPYLHTSISVSSYSLLWSPYYSNLDCRYCLS